MGRAWPSSRLGAAEGGTGSGFGGKGESGAVDTGGMEHGEARAGGSASDVALLREFGVYLRVERGLRPATVEAYGRDLLQFAEDLERRGGERRLVGAREEDVREFLKVMRANGVESRSLARKLSALRGMYRWLLLDRRVGHDPTANLERPSTWKVLPKSIGESEVVEILERAGAAARLPDATAAALRDHAILELVYAGGLRVGEICALRVEDLKLDAGRAQVRGKGDKDRVVPLGRAACEALEAWIRRGRPEMQRKKGVSGVVRMERRLFLGRGGGPISRGWVWAMVRREASLSGLKASPHTFRHSCATHMVEHGADLRSVQTILGHADIGTTEVYTHTAMGRLKAVHRAHHPRGRSRGGVA